MAIRKSMILILCLIIPVLGISGQVVTLDQKLHFKWRGLPVATTDIKVSLPADDCHTMISTAGERPTWPKTLIEVSGRTRGVLRMVQDYEATIKYLQLDDSNKNALTLLGRDDRQAEHREILFGAESVPRVSIFKDSTAKNALQPRLTWVRDTSNPLDIFRLMLESGINDEDCSAQTWGYDGKRRYFLRLENADSSFSRAGKLIGSAQPGSELVRRYVCKVTMYAEGRETAVSEPKSSMLMGAIAFLWPFAGGDREIEVDFEVIVNTDERRVSHMMLNEIRVATPFGAIVGRG